MITLGQRRWSLGAKLAAVGLPFLLLALITATSTLWVSWQLDGGGAAVNETGRLRMQVYRLMWSTTGTSDLATNVAKLDASLALLDHGDPERPLVMPWDDSVRQRFDDVRQGWQHLRGSLLAQPPQQAATALDGEAVALVARIDGLVAAIELHLARYTALMHLLQVLLLVLGVAAGAALVITGYSVVLEPVTALAQGVRRLREGDFDTRVAPASGDELGALAAGFNDMAERLQSSYHDLEHRVQAKTAELEQKRERLQALYDASTQVAEADSLQTLATGFVQLAREALRADGAMLRWAGEDDERLVMLAATGVPAELLADEHCIRRGDCHCGVDLAVAGARVIPIRSTQPDMAAHCQRAGWSTVVAVPVHHRERQLGELNLFFHADYTLGEAERTLLEALCVHLASGLENLRLAALEKEAAVAEERAFIARELHDSIAQSLAFLNIQVQLMRDALALGDRQRIDAVLAEISLGLKESHGDVRELLTHFRTRTNAEDIEPALRTTLRKFEHQSGVPATLQLHGHGLPLPPDRQVQALHIVQEALSNVRKHARAGQVQVEVWRQPCWRFEVRDDGQGFDPAALPPQADVHVGLRIMRERAGQLGGQLQVQSRPGQGTVVTLTLPPIGALGNAADVIQPAGGATQPAGAAARAAA
jgi:two-component system, NarL family, nitrate/nitrite sensor histidine kinase NarX